jgi:predicted SAM-dependent methyltransferase
MVARRPRVIAHDLVRSIPLKSESADVVYNSALLEHIRRSDVPNFLREIHRVLKPGGLTRIGVPDWEKICRTYVQKLEAALAGGKKAEDEYDWITLEMLDQLVREKSGGMMLEYLHRESLPEFVFDRIGNEGRDLVRECRQSLRANAPAVGKTRSSVWERTGEAMRNGILRLLEGPDAAEALAIGRFRLSGEAHHWMYDRFSLARELMAADFSDPRICSAFESSIPNWQEFHLDTQSDGTINKPDLFFMEATKPA